MAVRVTLRSVAIVCIQFAVCPRIKLCLATEILESGFHLFDVERRVRALAIASLTRFSGLPVLRLFLAGLPRLALPFLARLTFSRLTLPGLQLLRRLG